MLFRSLGNRAQPLLICGVDPSIAVRVGSWGNRQARLRRKLGTGIDDRDTPGTAQAFLRPCRLSVVGEMIEPGQRAGVDGKAKSLVRRHRTGVRKGGEDRARSDERRAGEEWGRKCRSRGSP